jgi:hypothetical protein
MKKILLQLGFLVLIIIGSVQVASALPPPHSVIFLVPTQYKVTSSVTAGSGTIDPLGDNFVNAGATPSYVIAPLDGYQINQILVNGAAQALSSPYVFLPVSSDQTISASFSLLPVSSTPKKVKIIISWQDRTVIEQVVLTSQIK